MHSMVTDRIYNGDVDIAAFIELSRVSGLTAGQNIPT